MLKSEKTYRDIKFEINRLHHGQWVWVVSPKKGKGGRFAGCVDGNKKKTIDACKAAIDGWIAAKSN